MKLAAADEPAAEVGEVLPRLLLRPPNVAADRAVLPAAGAADLDERDVRGPADAADRGALWSVRLPKVDLLS